MSLDPRDKERIADLVRRSKALSRGESEYDYFRNKQQHAECVAWGVTLSGLREGVVVAHRSGSTRGPSKQPSGKSLPRYVKSEIIGPPAIWSSS